VEGAVAQVYFTHVYNTCNLSTFNFSWTSKDSSTTVLLCNQVLDADNAHTIQLFLQTLLHNWSLNHVHICSFCYLQIKG